MKPQRKKHAAITVVSHGMVAAFHALITHEYLVGLGLILGGLVVAAIIILDILFF